MKLMKLQSLPLMLLMTLSVSSCAGFLNNTKTVEASPAFCPLAVHALPEDKTYLESLVVAPPPYTMPQSFKNLVKRYADENEDVDKYCSMK